MRLPVRRAREPLVVVGHEAALNERARARRGYRAPSRHLARPA